MLPWEVTAGGRTFSTYNVRVSLALARLLPEGFLNSDILAGRPHGRGFSREIGDAIDVTGP
jgi:hypothetical protein